MAFTTFAPCILLPEWRDWQTLRWAELVEQQRVDVLRGTLEREKRTLEAIRTDPAVVTRLAQRDLRLYRRDERAVLVSLPDGPEPRERLEPVPPPPPPEFVGKLLAVLPEYDYVELFCDGRTRKTLLVLSTALLALAFALFTPALQPNPER
jgi:hypothetical protein